MRVEQNRQADLAEQAGNRALLLAAATAIGVVAEYLMAAAISAGRRRWLYWPAGAAAVSVILAAGAFI
jgi:bacteriorhodopsin